MKKCIHWLAVRPTVIIVLLTLTVELGIWGCSLLIRSWYENLYGSIGGPGETYLNAFSLGKQIFMSVFLGPLFETALFQLLVVFLLQRFTRFPLWLIIGISALLFALNHYYSVFYIIFIFFSGFIYATVFMACQQKRSYGFAFLIVSLIHGLYNSIGFFID